MSTSKVLVTGGCGYIGSMVCKVLKKANIIPIYFDNLSRGHLEFAKYGPFFKGDLRSKEDIIKALNQYKPDAVIHMAALAYVVESIEKPDFYYQNNVIGSINLLSAMVECGVPLIVFSSTCATYGKPLKVPMDESHPQNPINPYGRSKYMIEKIIEDYQLKYPIKSAILRYFNAAGADLDSEVGELHDPETHIIPNLIQAAMGLKENMMIYGNDFPTDDGTAVRDYIHVNDLADAHLIALKHIDSTKESITINLGTGKGHSILEVLKAVEDVVGLKVPYVFKSKRKGEPPLLIANNEKAKRILNFKPKYSDLNKIISSAYGWHTKVASLKT